MMKIQIWTKTCRYRYSYKYRYRYIDNEDKETPKKGCEVIKGLKERPLKGPLGLYRDFMRLYKGYIRVI